MIKKISSIILLVVASQVPLFSASAQDRPQSTVLNVQYVSQVPLGHWSDPRQSDGCEEAAMIMAMAWVWNGTSAIPGEEAERSIINISEYERAILGFYQDTSAQDTAQVMRDYYQYKDIIVKENISVEDVKQELASNRVVILPFDPRLTGLAMYRGGPTRHTIVVVGYDDASNQLIINDPLYGNLHNFWVSADAINKGLRNYDSGIHKSTANGTALISIGRASIMY
ncbi:MAG TPA: C39 family peptidase [Patescibacteria group bacterium]|jgi:hypothetical protein|nr:C39 family peptidase [Patescibacteria group bacterium]